MSRRNESDRSRPPPDDRQSRRSGTRSVVLGLKGGLFATLAMTAFRMPISRSLPPTAHICAQYLGGSDDPSDFHLLSALLHLLYGVVCATLFASKFADLEVREPGRAEGLGLLAGLGYGLDSSIVGTHVVLDRLLGLDLDLDEAVVFHAGHAVYGAMLGGYVASQLSRDDG